MPIELAAHTPTGARLVTIAEELSHQLAARAAEHDRDGTYPFEAIDALKATGYFAAPIPIELGGLGVSVSARPGRRVQPLGSRRRVGCHRGEHASGRGAEHGAPPERRGGGQGRASCPRLCRLARADRRDGVVLAAAISERGQDLTRPGTVATRTGSGWRIDGRKMFCTMSPAATDLYVAVTYADEEGVERYAYAMVPTHAPGVVIHDDWDAMGMRASGSNSVSLEGVELPESGVRGGFVAGDPCCHTWSATCTPGCFTPRPRSASPSRPTRSPAAASPGGSTATRARACRWPTSGGPRRLTRGAVTRGELIDEHRAANPASDGSADELSALFAEAQAAKAFVNEAAAHVVDRALALSGGAGYVNGSPLARAYRDVKAGTFMLRSGPTAPMTTSPKSPSANNPHSTDMLPATHTQPLTTIDPSAFRNALGRFATSVAFVTAAPGGEPNGLIVNSLSSVSLEPPLISFCPAKASLTWQRMRRTGHFAVNILDSDTRSSQSAPPPPPPIASPASTGNPGAAATRSSPTHSPRSNAKSSPNTRRRPLDHRRAGRETAHARNRRPPPLLRRPIPILAIPRLAHRCAAPTRSPHRRQGPRARRRPVNREHPPGR